MDNQALLAAIDAFAETAYGSSTTSELGTQRTLSIQRYLGSNINPAPAGRSQVRDRTVYETIEWIKPSLLRIFCGSDQIVEFDPIGPEDEERAQQESQYTNYVVTQKNNWHQLCNDWFGDALLLKNGYMHAYYETRTIPESEYYRNLTDDAFALLAQDKELTIVEQSSRVNEELKAQQDAQFAQAMQQYQMMVAQAQMQAQPPTFPGAPGAGIPAGVPQGGVPQQQPQLPPPPQRPPVPKLWDCEVKRTQDRGQVRMCVLPPERCLIDIDTPDWTLDGCNYFEYWDYETIGSLRARGLNVKDDIVDDENSAATSRSDGSEEGARDLYSESQSRGTFNDPSMKRLKVRYIWIRHDTDGDGINELQYVIRIGQEVIYSEEAEDIPVASLTPIPLPHRHIGMSIADSVEDIEDVNTNITRGAIDNLNLSNTPRLAVSDRVNMSDLLDVRVGGVIRVDGQPPQEIMPVDLPNVFGAAVNAIQFFDSRRMNRTGINAYFQGTDSNTLNKTASGINQLTSSAAQRVEMIARLFAIGVKRLFTIVHRLILQHGHSREVIRIRNNWVTVDPAEWRKRSDLRIVVGLGTGSKEGQIAQLGQLFAAQMQTLPLGVAEPQNIYHTLVEMAKASGFAGSERFFVDPTTKPPPQPPPPPEVIVEQMRGQTAMQSKQLDVQSNQKTQQMRQQFDAAQLQHDAQMQERKAQLDAETELKKAQIDAQKQYQIEQMRLEASRQETLMKLAADMMMAESKNRMDAQVAMHESAQSASESGGHEQMMSQMMQKITELAQTLAAPKQVVRDNAGRVVGVQTVQ